MEPFHFPANLYPLLHSSAATLLFPIFKDCHLSPLDTGHCTLLVSTGHYLCPLDSVQRHKCHACRSASGDQLLFFDFARGQELVSCKIELPSASLESRAHASLKLLDWGGLQHHVPECTMTATRNQLLFYLSPKGRNWFLERECRQVFIEKSLADVETSRLEPPA